MTFNVARVIADTGDRQDYYESVMAREESIRRNRARISGNVIGGAISEEYLSEDVEVGGDLLETVATVGDYSGDNALTVKFYVDETLQFTKEVYAKDVPFTITGGIRGRKFEIQVEGNVKVLRVDMATSMKELKMQPQQEGQ